MNNVIQMRKRASEQTITLGLLEDTVSDLTLAIDSWDGTEEQAAQIRDAILELVRPAPALAAVLGRVFDAVRKQRGGA